MRPALGFYSVLVILGTTCSAFDFSEIDEGETKIAGRGFFEIARLKREIKSSPRDAGLILELSSLYLKRGQLEDAKAYLDLAHRRGAASSDYLHVKGLLAMQSGDYSEAEKAFFAAIASNNSASVYCYASLSHLYLKTANFQKGLRWASLGLKLHSMSPQLMALASYHLIKLERYKEAELTLMAARKLKPNDPIIPYNLACLYAYFKDQDAVTYNLRKAARNGFSKLYMLELEPLFNPFETSSQFLLIVREIRKNFERNLESWRLKRTLRN